MAVESPAFGFNKRNPDGRLVDALRQMLSDACGRLVPNALARAGARYCVAMSEENVEVVRTLFEAVGRGEIETALQRVRPDGEWVNPDNAMEPGTRRGLSGVRTALTALRDSFDDLRFEISQTLDLEDRVLVIGTFSGVGRTSGAAFGPRPFGAVVTLAEGQVQRYEWYLSHDEARAAAGLSEYAARRWS